MSVRKKILHHSKKIFEGARDTLGYFHKKIQDIQKRENEEDVPFPQSLPEVEKGKEKRIVEISLINAVKIIAVVFLILLLGQFLEKIGSILILFFSSLFLASALMPGVDWLEKKKIPSFVGVLVLYFAIFSVVIVLISGLLPAVVDQLTSIIVFLRDRVLEVNQGDFSKLPEWMQEYKVQIKDSLDAINETFQDATKDSQTLIDLLNQNSTNIKDFGNTIASGVVGVIFGFISAILQMFLVLVITYFIVLDRKNIKAFFVSLFPRHYQHYASKKVTTMQDKIAKWVHGQVLLFLLVGGITYIGLQIIGVPYALTLALIAGIAEFLPYIGPPIAFLSAAPFAFGQGIETGLFLIGLYIFIQIIEGNVLVPLVMEKAVGISPIMSIFAILIGFTLLGIPGAIVAIPIVAMLQIFIGDYLSWRGENDGQEQGKSKDLSGGD